MKFSVIYLNDAATLSNVEKVMLQIINQGVDLESQVLNTPFCRFGPWLSKDEEKEIPLNHNVSYFELKGKTLKKVRDLTMDAQVLSVKYITAIPEKCAEANE